MPTVHVVADDLTGACDTGHEFARRGYDAVVRLDRALDANPTVLIDDTDSRYVAPDVAYGRVADVVSGTDADLYYKKVDSTLRGNLGSEINAATDVSGAAAALVAPAFPSNGRLTACGQHLVHGRPVTETDPGRDADNPVRTAHLPSLLSRENRRVVHVPIDLVASGVEGLESALSAALVHAKIVTVDAVDDHNLSDLTTAAASIDPAVVYVGSAGLARHVKVPIDPTNRDPTRLVAGAGRSFAAVGSVNQVTLAQVATVQDSRVVELDAALAVTDPDAAADRATKACLERFASEPSVVLVSATDERDVAAALDRADQADIPRTRAKHRIAEALASVTAAVLTETQPNGLFLSGGAVASAALATLGALGLRLTGAQVATGVPEGRVIGGDADGTTAVTKAGGFGAPDTLVEALEILR